MTTEQLALIVARHAGRDELNPWHAGEDVDPDELIDAAVEAGYPPEMQP